MDEMPVLYLLEIPKSFPSKHKEGKRLGRADCGLLVFLSPLQNRDVFKLKPESKVQLIFKVF